MQVTHIIHEHRVLTCRSKQTCFLDLCSAKKPSKAKTKMAAEPPEPPADSKILASIKDLKLDFVNGLDGMKTAIEEIMSDVKDCLDWTMHLRC